MGRNNNNNMAEEKKGPCASCAPDWIEPADMLDKSCMLTACCCNVCGFYCDYPDCCGIRSKSACLCCESKSQCSLMKLACEQTCFQQCTMCKGFTQHFCCIQGVAIPCDDDVPCMIACLGIFCLGKEKMKTSNVAATQQVDVAPKQAS